jgi:hypothetical protein
VIQRVTVTLGAFLLVFSQACARGQERAGGNGAVAPEQNTAAVPRFDYSTTLGCGDLFFHAMNSGKTEVLRIEIKSAQPRSSVKQQVYDLAERPSGVIVDISLYRREQINQPNCTDLFTGEAGVPPNTPEVWHAVGGRLEVERSPKRPEDPQGFRATIRLLGARFQGPGGRVVEMPKPFSWEGLVGWLAG